MKTRQRGKLCCVCVALQTQISLLLLRSHSSHLFIIFISQVVFFFSFNFPKIKKTREGREIIVVLSLNSYYHAQGGAGLGWH
jgi:hypothetical protein